MDSRAVIEQAYADFAAGRLPDVLAVFADDISWTEAAGFPYAGTYTGGAAVTSGVFQRMGTEWDGYRVEPEVLIADGDEVAALGWYSGTYRATGKAFRARFVHWWRLADGRITSFEQVTDTTMVNAALVDD